MHIYVRTVDVDLNDECEAPAPKKQRLLPIVDRLKAGRTLSFCQLSVKQADTIKAVKAKLRIAEGLSLTPEEMRLFYGEEELLNHQTVRSFNFESGCVLYLIARDRYRMPIFVESSNRKAYRLEMEPNDTIENLKIQIQVRDRILPEEMKLLYADKELDDSKTLKECNINKGAVLHLVLRSKTSIEIYIETLVGKAFTLEVEPSDTIESVKRKIEVEEKMSRDHFRLFFAGRELENEETLSDCNIESRSMLQLVTGPRYMMRLLIKLKNGETTFVEVEPSDTIDKIMIRIQNKDGISSDNMYLIFLGQILRKNQTVKECDLSQGSVLYLITNLQDTIQIFVKTPTGKTFTLDVKPLDMIRMVKTEVQKKEGCAVEQIGILFIGKELNDEKTFSHYMIEKGSLLHSIIRSRNNIEVVIEISNKITEVMKFEPSDTIDKVKVRIQDVRGISTDEISLFFNEKELKDSDELSEYMSKKENPLKLKFELKRRPNSQRISSTTNLKNFFCVYIKTVSGRNHLIETKSSDTIEDLKKKIVHSTGYPTDQQRLIFDSKLLEDGRTLSDYAIQHQSVIYFIQHQRGS